MNFDPLTPTETKASKQRYCPVCETGIVIEKQAKLVCSQCHTVCENCCGG